MIYKTRIYDITEIFSNTESKIIRESLKNNKRIFCIKLDNLKGLIGFEIQNNRRIGTELADVAKRFGLKGILHSDELPGYGIKEEEIKKVKEKINANDNDGYIILIADNYEKAKIVFRYIIYRINELLKGVPKDTRGVNPDFTTSFLRPQPGSERMYPETDHPYIYLDKKIENKEDYKEIIYEISYGNIKYEYRIIKLEKEDIDLYFKMKGKYDILNSLDPEFRKNILKKLGYNEKQIYDILWNEYLDIIEDLSYKYKNPNIIYYMFFQMRSDIKKEYNEDIDLNIELIEKILDLYSKDKITRNSIYIVYYKSLKNNKEPEDILKEEGLEKIKDINILKEKIKKFIEENKIDQKNIKKEVFNKFKYIADSSDIEKVLNEFSK